MKLQQPIDERYQARISTFMHDLLAISGCSVRSLKLAAAMGQSSIEKCLSAKTRP